MGASRHEMIPAAGRRRRKRSLLAVAAAIAILATAFVTSATAQTPPPPLGNTGNAAVRLSLPGHPFADLDDLFANGCDVDGTSVMPIVATGTAYGPYPGTFDMVGTATLGPQNVSPGFSLRGPNVPYQTNQWWSIPVDYRGQVMSFDVSFTINSGSYTITGTQTLDLTSPIGNAGLCQEIVDNDNHWAIKDVYGPVAKLSYTVFTYEATIIGPDGVWVDSGTGRIEANYSELCGRNLSPYQIANWCTGGLSEGTTTTFMTSNGVQPGDPDRDGDGIPNEIDPEPDTHSYRFEDPVGASPVHYGEILGTSTLTDYELVDLPYPQGVLVSTAPSTAGGFLRVRVCDAFTLWIPPDTSVPVSCGSVTVTVDVGGPVQIRPDGEATVVIYVPVGTTAHVTTPDAQENFVVEHRGGPGQITIFVDGSEQPPLNAGGTTQLSTNAAPVITAVDAPIAPVQLGQAITVEATFEDPGSNDSHTCAVDWGDGTNSVGTVIDGVLCRATRSYTAAGVFNPVITVTDDAGDSDSASPMVVVFDPEGGFVTGGGHYESPAGAFVADPDATGKATFGFVSKYKRGSFVPSGNTQFQFKAGDLNFHSDVYEWLVITGGESAQFRGTGTINGEGQYSFRIWATDAPTGDTFRIQIWSDTSEIYDNGPHQTIDGGNITVHS